MVQAGKLGKKLVKAFIIILITKSKNSIRSVFIILNKVNNEL